MRAISASIRGSEHAALDINNQDAHIVIQKPDYTILVLCDGVTNGKEYRTSHNEAAAWMQATLVASALDHYARDLMPLDAMPYALSKRIDLYYRQILNFISPPSYVEYANHYLAATLLTAVLRPDDGIIMAAGDGIIQIDDSIMWLDQHGEPRCPVFNQFREQRMDIHRFDSWNKVGLMSDGMYPRITRDDDQFDHARFRTLVEDFLWWKTTSSDLKRQLNIWQREDHPYFYDDATVVLAMKEPYL